MNEYIAAYFDITLKALTSVATIIVAVYVAIVSKRQWKNNQEKLRLDLYEHRFDIYMRVLNFYGELIMWKDSEEQKTLIQPFIKAFRESRFLFPESSGVYAFLVEFSRHAFQITNHQSAIQSWGTGFGEEKMKRCIEREEHLAWIMSLLGALEDKMAPFLNFHSL